MTALTMDNTGETFTIKTLGWIRADFKQKFGTPRQGSLATHSRAMLELAKPFRGRGLLSGLEGFSHVWIVSYLHLSVTKRQRGKVHPPRLRGQKVGVMASRSPHRPNNIGLTLSRILKVDGDQLFLSEVDLIDGTPVLDLKPYLAEADRPQEYSSGWTENVEPITRNMDFSQAALRDIETLAEGKVITDPERVLALIEEMLVQDPRPPAYLDREECDFAIWVAGLNVNFRFSNGKFTVMGVEKAD